MSKSKILIVDDEDKMRRILQIILRNDSYDIDLAENGTEAWELCNRETYHLVITDLKMPGMSGMELLGRIMKRFVNLQVIVITAYGSIESAVAAMKCGAFDYITKPFDKEEIRITVSKAIQFNQLKGESRYLRAAISGNYDFSNIIGESPCIQNVRELAAKVAPTASTVLVRGESGTGKELIARIIHFNSPRASAPFIAFNCGALPEPLIESELFGYEPGAFTGAKKQKPGRFELANTGTIFLDEIGDMQLELQVKLLRVLQEKHLERLGATKSIPVNVRIIAATHRDLKVMVEEGKFRADLYYRLNIFPILIPSIRAHKEDLPLIITHFLGRLSNEIGKPVPRVTNEAMKLLVNYDWPGNVREIQNCLERAIILCNGKEISPKELVLEAPWKPKEILSLLEYEIPNTGISLVAIEKAIILKALEKSGYNQSQAAKLLAITRNTLRYRMEKYGIEIPD
jgi:two-component system response regulator AtoC